MNHVGIIDAFGTVGSEIFHIIVIFNKIFLYLFFEFVAGMIAGYGYFFVQIFHVLIKFFYLQRYNFYHIRANFPSLVFACKSTKKEDEKSDSEVFNEYLNKNFKQEQSREARKALGLLTPEEKYSGEFYLAEV